ncbi:MAG TPA: outer membrane protein assembly factor BamA [Cytophagaceae bacterium]|jgi:outer membrane protein insertion porin family|nr:outer membrane protein assembly factor BamA [Cytophagaceae bacterium]
MNKYIILTFGLLISTIAFGQKKKDTNYKSPTEYIIGEITVSGVQFLDPSAIIAITNLKPGDKINIPGDQISNAIKRIWDQGLIGDVEVNIVKIEGNVIYLDFLLKERPRLSKYVFNKGVKKSEKDDLLEKIDHTRGTVVNDAMIKNAQKKIRNFYLEKGYYNAVVSILPVKDSLLDNNIYLSVTVNKNKKVKVKNIYFHGNEELTAKDLKKKMKKTKEQRLYTFFVSSKFIKKQYEADKEKIIEYYNSKGFRDAVIVKDSISVYKDNKINLDITIDEGKKYYFRNFTWKGNYLYSSGRLDSILNIKKGTLYNADLLQRRINFNPNGVDIGSLYMDNGYLFYNLEPVEFVDGDSIDIEMRIYEGKPAIIDKITISGNTKTHDHVILRELRTVPGEKFSRSDLIRSQRELSTLGYFDPEKVDINPVPNPAKGTVDIHYKVTEKPSDQIQLSGGWGGGSRTSSYGYGGLTGTLGLVFNNFSIRNITKFKTWDPLPAGDGQRFSINFQSNGRMYQNYSTSFMEPWFLGKKPISFNVSLNHSNSNAYDTKTAKYDQHLDITSFTTGLGRRLKKPDDFFTLQNSLTYSRYHYRNYGNYSRIGIDTGFSTNISFNTTLSRNSIDEFNFPTKGSSIALHVSLTPPWSLFDGINYANPNLAPSTRYKFVEYHKWGFDSDWYATLIPGKKRNLVIRAKTNFGFIGSYRAITGIGPFERYVMGGNGMFGYYGAIGTDFIGLRGYQSYALPYGKYSSVGGTVFDKFTMEIRYPIATSQALSLSILGFFEAGNVWDTPNKFSPFDVYRSAGVGARIFMPAFGLIGLDYGFPMDLIPGQSINPGGNPHYKPVFTFTIGQQLR